MMRPGWAGSPCGCPARLGARSPWTRMSRNTRALPACTPCCRSRTRTLRCPSLWNGLAASTARIRVTTSASLWAVFGPRFAPAVSPLPGTVAYTLDRGTCHTPRGADTASPSPDCGAGSFPQPPQVLPELFFRAGARRDRGASSSPRPSPAVAAPRAPRDQARGASAPAGHSPGTPAATLRARAPGPDSRGRPRRSPRPGRAGVRSPPSLRTPPLGEVIRSLRRHRRLCHWSAPSLCSVQRNRDRPNRDVVQFLSSRSFAFLVGSEGTGVSLEQHAVALADSRWYGPGPKRYPMCWWKLLVAVGADASNPATARAPRDRLRPGQ